MGFAAAVDDEGPGHRQQERGGKPQGRARPFRSLREEVRLLPLTAAFFAGRVVSYSIYVSGAAAVKQTAGEGIVDNITSPLGIVVQLLALAGLVALLRVDWMRLLRRPPR